MHSASCFCNNCNMHTDVYAECVLCILCASMIALLTEGESNTSFGKVRMLLSISCCVRVSLPLCGVIVVWHFMDLPFNRYENYHDDVFRIIIVTMILTQLAAAITIQPIIKT